MTESEALATVEYHLTPEEWVAVSQDELLRTEVHRQNQQKQRRALGLMAFLSAALALLLDATPFALVATATFALSIALVPRTYRRALRKALQRNARTGIVPGMFGVHRMEVRPEGLRDVTSSYATTWQWSAVERVDDVDGAFVIRTGPFGRLILPSSAFRDAASVRRFSDAFYAQVAKARASELASPDPTRVGDG